MTTALLLTTPSLTANNLQADLQAVGIPILGICNHTTLVQDTIRLAPDVLVVQLVHDDGLVFDALQVLHEHAPLPVLLFTANMDAAHADHALAVGVQEIIYGPCDPRHLRPWLHLAQSRFKRQRQLQDELGAVTQRFEERKLVDRAKGILMSMRRLSEPEAFTVLRTAAMQGAMRVGDAARAVIDGARQAADVNRSGQLRMLSQRIVKLQALVDSGTRPAEARALLQLCVERVDELVASLRSELSPASFGDLLEGLLRSWEQLRTAVHGAAPANRSTAALDTLAQALLEQSDMLTTALEHAGSGSSLTVVNRAGRQRMLSQRFAKLALLGHAPAELVNTRVSFEEGQAYLEQLPLRSPDITTALTEVRGHWQALRQATALPENQATREAIANHSEALLEALDQLTSHYQRSLQVLLG